MATARSLRRDVPLATCESHDARRPRPAFLFARVFLRASSSVAPIVRLQQYETAARTSTPWLLCTISSDDLLARGVAAFGS